MNCGLSEASRTARRMAAFAVTAWMVLGTLLIASPARAGSIFDDNWTPPKAAKPAEPPPDAGPSKPAKPPETSKPDTQAAPPAAVAPTPTVAAPPARRPVPAAADQAKSRKLFKEIFATELADRSAAARRALATKLLEQAATVSDAPSDQFVLLVGAGEAGTEAHDLGLCCRAADAMGEAYDVDALRIKSDNALKMTLRAETPAATTENCRVGLKLVDQLVAADDYATAGRLLAALRAASSDTELTAQIQSRAKEVDSLRTTAERAAAYLQKLKTAPDDPVANLMAGQYFCFSKDDWKRGLPLLAKGGKTSESAAAALDLAGASEPSKQVTIGDAWWNIAEREVGPTQIALRGRAAGWYRMALQHQTISGLTRVLLEKRVAAAPTKAGAVATGAVDLLALVNVTRDAVGEGWSVQPGRGLVTDGKQTELLMLPYEPPEEYDFLVEFTRLGGRDMVALMFPASDSALAWSMGSHGAELKFDVTGRHLPSGTNDPSCTALNTPFASLVKVRREGLEILLNGKTIIAYQGPLSDLRATRFALPNTKLLGIGTWKRVPTVFTKVQVTPITGVGRVTKPE